MKLADYPLTVRLDDLEALRTEIERFRSENKESPVFEILTRYSRHVAIKNHEEGRLLTEWIDGGYDGPAHRFSDHHTKQWEKLWDALRAFLSE